MRRPFTNLTLDERRVIARMLQAKVPKTKIAAMLGRDRSTITREVKRNWWHDKDVPQADGYWHMTAQSQADHRRSRRRKLERLPDLRAEVIRCLHEGWTPEQIAGRMRYECAPSRACQETIYQHIYSEDGRRGELWRHLPSGRRRRRGYRLRKRPPPKFALELSILFRPDIIAHRSQFGH